MSAPDPVERSLRAHRPVDPGWAEVALAVELFATAPIALGGLCLRARPGPRRDQVCDWVREAIEPAAPMRRMPAHTAEDRLLGGLALADTLRTGSVVVEAGLLARTDGGVLVVPMAERLEERSVAHLCAAVDRGEVRLEREGLAERVRCRLGLLVLDEGVDDEAPPAAIVDRCAFLLDLDALAPRSLPVQGPVLDRVAAARAALPQVTVDEGALLALARVAERAGIAGIRPLLRAAIAARCHAALAGRGTVEEPDLVVAARLVLGPRATRMPEPEPETSEDESPEPSPAQPSPDTMAETEPDDEGTGEGDEGGAGGDVLLDAVQSGIPEGLLDRLRLGTTRSGRRAGRSGAFHQSSGGGRPAGTRAGTPRPPERLAVVATLRAAAPWQAFRRRTAPAGAPGVIVRPEDFRIRRHRERTETSVIFAVDASGSAALQRLAEAKGAVEQVLADCYVRRDHVALLAFREDEATLVVPPTRSLTRARRCLAQLAGGGPTPLAAGVDAARELALDARRRGRTPLIVLMTDGRANVARDGSRGGPAATEDALDAARLVREERIACLLLDTAPRPRRRVRRLAEAMGAVYFPMPYLNTGELARHVRNVGR